MRVIATLGIVSSLELATALRDQAAQLRRDAALYLSQGSATLARESEDRASEFEALADGIGCGPIQIRTVDE
jgi:hypothetical protein